MKISILDPALVLLIGPAGAGKSTFAAAHFHAVEIVSSDHLRALLSNDPADQGASAEAFRILSLLVAGRLARRLTTVVDATSLRAANRTRYRAIAARHAIPVVAIAFNWPADVYHRRNRGRAGGGRVVEDGVVDRQTEQMRRTVAALPDEGYATLYELRDPDDPVSVERA